MYRKGTGGKCSTLVAKVVLESICTLTVSLRLPNSFVIFDEIDRNCFFDRVSIASSIVSLSCFEDFVKIIMWDYVELVMDADLCCHVLIK